LVGFLACLYRRRYGFLSAVPAILAALEQILRALFATLDHVFGLFAQLASLALRIIPALFRAACQILARILTGLWREENPRRAPTPNPTRK